MTEGVKLASGYISLGVQYEPAMKKIAEDFTGFQRQADQAGRKAGDALAKGVSAGAEKANKDIHRQLVGSNIGMFVGRSIGEGINTALPASARGAIRNLAAVYRVDGAAAAAGTAIGRTIGTSIKAGLTISAGAGVAAVGYTLTQGFQRLEKIDQARFKLQALGNSASDVDEIMKNAEASVKGTAFALDEAASSAASAVAAGIRPGKDLTQYLTTISDTAAIAGTSFSDMASIFNKVTTNNKAYTDDLQMLADRGIPIFQYLRDEYNVSADDLQKMVEDGKVSAADFGDALESHIGGSSKKMGDSFSGAMSNMQAAIARTGANFLASAFGSNPGDALAGPTDAVNYMTEKLDEASGWVKTHGPEIHQFFVDAKNVGKEFVDTVSPPLKAIGDTLRGHPELIANVAGAFATWKAIDGVSSLATNLTTVSSLLRIGLPTAATTGAAGILGALGPVGVEVAAIGAGITGLMSLLPEYANVTQRPGESTTDWLDRLRGEGAVPGDSQLDSDYERQKALNASGVQLGQIYGDNPAPLRPDPRKIQGPVPALPGGLFSPGNSPGATLQPLPPGISAPADMGGLLGLPAGGGGQGLNMPGQADAWLDSRAVPMGSTQGGAESWRSAVRAALQSYGPQYGVKNMAAWEEAMIRQIATESGGNPTAINNWDSNAKAGHPSQGLLQFIPSTFAAHNITGGSFTDPMAQIAAFIPYVMQRYGVDANGAPLQVGRGVGYDEGGWLQPGTTVAVNSSGEPELVLTGDQASSLINAGQVDPSTSQHGLGGGRLPGPPAVVGKPEGGNPAAELLAGDRTQGYVPAGAGNTSVSGTSFLSGIYNMGAEVVNGLIDQGASLASSAATAALAAGTMGAGAAGAPAAGAAAQALIGMGTQAAKRGVSYGFQMAGIGTDALLEQLSPFGMPRWLTTDVTGFMPQQGIMQAATTSIEKAFQQGNQPPGGPGQPTQPGGPLPGPPPGPPSPLTPPTQPLPGTPAANPSTPPPAQPQNPEDLLTHFGVPAVYDEGGWLQPNSLAINKTKSVEPMAVFNGTQWDTLSSLASTPMPDLDPAMASSGGDYRIILENVSVADPEALQRKLDDYQTLRSMRYRGRPTRG